MKYKNFLNKLRLVLEQPGLIWAKLHGIPPVYYYHCLTAKELSKIEIKTLIDIGANIGNYSKTGKIVFPNAKIYAFEPIKECYDQIKDESITAFNFALWDLDNKKDIFYLNKENTEMSSFLKYGFEQEDKKKDIQKINILKRRFDKLKLEINRPCFVKIDVEGGEDRVIRGFGNRLKEVDVLQIEWHFGDYYEGHEKLSNMIKLLEKNGLNGFIQKSVGHDNDNMPYMCDLFFFRTKT